MTLGSRFKIRKVLQKEAFQIISETNYTGFGDFRDVYSSYELLLVVTTDKGEPFIELGNSSDVSRTYDVPLVKSFLLEKNCLLEQLPIEMELHFVLTNIEKIRELFSIEHISNTHIKLDRLKIERSRILFPSWDPE